MATLDLAGAVVNRATITNIDKLIIQIQNCSSLECLANSAEVVKGKLLASQQGERARLTAEVIPLLEQRLAGLGQDVDGLASMGNKYLDVNEISQAFAYYSQALRLDPMNVTALAGIAKAYAVLFQRELPTKTVNSNTVANLKEAYWFPALENIFFAIELLAPECGNALDHELYDIKKIFADAWFEKGYTLLRYIEECRKYIPPSSNAVWPFEVEYSEAATVCFDRILEIAPQSRKALFAKSIALSDQGKAAEADMYYIKANIQQASNGTINEDNYFTRPVMD
ncbi:MAG: hypothetical protein HY438_00730 [DPANN group archaeon]|nr:hypothetical protein [DPANN group archaeon]